MHAPVLQFQNRICRSAVPPPLANTLGCHGHHANACKNQLHGYTLVGSKLWNQLGTLQGSHLFQKIKFQGFSRAFPGLIWPFSRAVIRDIDLCDTYHLAHKKSKCWPYLAHKNHSVGHNLNLNTIYPYTVKPVLRDHPCYLTKNGLSKQVVSFGVQFFWKFSVLIPDSTLLM